MNRLEIAIEVMKISVSIAQDFHNKETFAKYCFDTAEAMLAEEAKRKEEENKPKEDPEGWIEWNGGECPVGGDVLVQCKLRGFRSGWRLQTLFADEWVWGRHNDPDYDIIAYRVIK